MSNVRVLRAPPTIATKRSEVAVESIRLKIQILNEWVTNGNPLTISTGAPEEQEWCPTSLREFADWNGTQNSAEFRAHFPNLRKCSRQTLTHHANLKSEVEQLLSAIKSRRAASERSEHPEGDPRQQYRKELKRRQNIEKAYLMGQRLVRDLKALNQRTKRIAEHEKRELREQLDAANARIRFLEGRKRRKQKD